MKTYLIGLTVALTIAGCGGSSSSDTDPVTDNKTNTLKVKVVNRNRCGIETVMNDAAILLHNNDFSIKQTIYADNNGLIEVNSDSQNLTYSIVARPLALIAGEKPLFITTFIDGIAHDRGTFTHYSSDLEQCVCSSGDIFVGLDNNSSPIERSKLTTNSGSSYSGTRYNFGYSEFRDIELCSGNAPAKASTILFTDESAFATFSQNIEAGNSLIANTKGQEISFTGDNYHHISSFINKETYFRQSKSSYNNDPIYAFSIEDTTHYRAESYNFEELPSTQGIGSGYIFSSTSQESETLKTSYNLQPPSVDASVLLNALTDESGSYDLTNIDFADYMYVSITGYTDLNNRLLSWSMIGPLKGKVSAFENLDTNEFLSDSFFESHISSIDMSISVVGYNGLNNYSDYYNQISTREAYVYTPQWSERQTARLSISLDDTSFSAPNFAAKFIPKSFSDIKLTPQNKSTTAANLSTVNDF